MNEKVFYDAVAKWGVTAEEARELAEKLEREYGISCIDADFFPGRDEHFEKETIRVFTKHRLGENWEL